MDLGDLVNVQAASVHCDVLLCSSFSAMSSTATETIIMPYLEAPETSASLEWANLVTLDLSKFEKPEGKISLAAEFTKAMDEVGMSEVEVVDMSFNC